MNPCHKTFLYKDGVTKKETSWSSSIYQREDLNSRSLKQTLLLPDNSTLHNFITGDHWEVFTSIALRIPCHSW